MKDKKVIKIIIIIVAVLLIAFLGFEFYNKNKVKINNNGNNKEDIYDVKKIVSDEKRLNELVSAIPYSNETMGVFNDAYSKDKSIINDVIGQAIISTFINYSRQYTTKGEYEDFVKFNLKSKGINVDKIYNIVSINELLRKNFNINLKTYDVPEGIEITDYDFGYCSIKYNKTDSLKHLKVSLDNKVYELNGELVMTEKVVFVVLKGDTYYVYANSDINNGQSPLKTFNANNKSIYDIVKEDFKDYNTVFRHTFRRNELGYYWYSTEMVN